MTDDHLTERLASLEARLGEMERQVKRNWERTDDNGKKIDDQKLSAVELKATLETRLNTMEKDSLRDSFGIKAQVAEVGWRVGIMAAIAMFILYAILPQVNLKGMFGDGQPTTSKGRNR